MKSQEYIINELEFFIKKFSKVRVRYEYDEAALVHTVEVLPNEVYHLNKDYISWERTMFDKFIALYPTENICFISDDALVGIENAIYIKEGLDYAPFSTKESSVPFDPNVILVQQMTFKGTGDITFSDEKIYKPIEDTRVPKEYSTHYRTFSLAA
jgi:hypothetical protein